MTIRCGNCIGCMIDDSRDWAARCMHEAKLHTHNCFITLTFNDEHLPPTPSLDHRTFQTFIKRLRENALSKETAVLRQLVRADRTNLSTTNTKAPPPQNAHSVPPEGEPTPDARMRAVIRYHMCGEYGPLNSRQHYHANMFGINFADRKYYKTTEAGYRLEKSETLDKIWGNGYASIGQLTWETAAYTARYNMKKAGEKNKKWEIINLETGEIIIREPEYQRMSRNPGIGKNWIKQFKTDVYPRGTILINGHESTTPRFYDDYYKTLDEDAYNKLKSLRQHEQGKRPVDITKSRLEAEETVTRAKLHFLKRQGNFE